MTLRFADSFYYMALLNRADAAHARAVQFSKTISAGTLTTPWVLTKVANALSAPPARAAFLRLLDSLQADSTVTLVPVSEGLFRRGLDLFRLRPDKSWSLTDCISFVVMEDHGVIEALTGDHHFEQAGFTALLR